MPLSNRDPWLDNSAAIRSYPDHVLLDIARNDSAQHDYRKLAVEVLLVRKSLKLKHPDLRPFVQELEVELDGIEFETPIQGSGPLTASITTETLYGVQNEFTGFDALDIALKSDIPEETPAVPTEIQSSLPTESAHAEIQETDATG